MIVKLAESEIQTKFGPFQEALYYDGQKETLAFFVGHLEEAEEVLCRVHSSCIYGHYMNSLECDCQEQLDKSQEMIAKEGSGIIILMDQEGKGNGHFALINSIQLKRRGVPQAQAYQDVGFKKDNRDFTAAGKILKAMKVKSVRMLTNNPKKVSTLEQEGIVVTGIRKIQ